MAIYVFYLCNPDGGSNALEAFDLGSDDDAPERALKLLADHPSCSYIAVWNEEREVMTSHRDAVTAPTVAGPFVHA